jgi:hypothetical protein
MRMGLSASLALKLPGKKGVDAGLRATLRAMTGAGWVTDDEGRQLRRGRGGRIRRGPYRRRREKRGWDWPDLVPMCPPNISFPEYINYQAILY